MYLHLKTSPERAKGHAASPAQGSGGSGGVQNANRVSAAFDVARWSQSPERWRRFHPPTPPPSPSTHTPDKHPSPCHWLSALWRRRRHSLHSRLVDGFIVCLTDCVRHINVYCFFLLWNEVAFLPSFALYLPLSLLPFFVSQYHLVWNRGPVAECSKNSLECGMRHLWNWHQIFWGKNSSHFTLLEVFRTSLFSTSNAVWCKRISPHWHAMLKHVRNFIILFILWSGSKYE